MITSFKGSYRFLSNFWYVPVRYNGKEYPSVEHAYQAAKSLDPLYREKIRQTSFPWEAKTLGNTCVLREEWEDIKITIMENLVRQKFSVPYLRELLLKTGDQELVEGNTWHDTYWGRCSCAGCNGAGENYLGMILMRIRDELQDE